MKKKLALLMAAVLTVGLLSACGESASSSSTAASSAKSEAATTETASASAATETASASAATETATEASADTIVIKCGIPSPITSVHAIALQAMNEYFAEKNLVQIEIMTDSVLGTERELPESVSMGTVQMAVIACSPLVNFDASFYMLDFPYLVNDRDAALDALNGDLGRELLSKLEASGIYGLGFFDQGFREVENNVTPVNSPADMANLKLRTLESDLFTGFFSALGANPVIMSNSEIITSLEQGTIDGVDYTISALYSSGTYPLVKNLAITDHIYSTLIPLINLDLWNSFSDEVKAEFEAAMAYALDYMKDYMATLEEESLAAFEESGIEITYPDKSAFQEATKDVAASYMDQIDVDLYERFVEACG